MSTNASISEGTSYQTAHTYFFVPANCGADTLSTDDDADVPGALLRLGGYSDLEATASRNDLEGFYPAQFMNDADSDPVAASGDGSIDGSVLVAAGTEGVGADDGPAFSNSSKGILLSADGNILIRAGEKTYIQSVGAMHVDVDDALTVETAGRIVVSSEDEIELRTGNEKNIVLSADGGKGDVDITSQNETRNCFGKSTEVVKDDKYTYFQADEFKIQMGRINQIILGGKFHIWIGATISIRAAIDTQIDLLGKFKYWTLKFDFGLFKFDFYMRKIEFKEGKVSVGAWTLKSTAAKVESDVVEVENAGTEVENAAVRVRAKTLDVGTSGIAVESGGPEVRTRALSCHM